MPKKNLAWRAVKKGIVIFDENYSFLRKALMNSSFSTFSLLLLAVCTPMVVYTMIDEDFTHIECEIKLRVRPFKQEDPELRSGELVPYSHPLIPLKRGSSNNWCGYVAAPNLSKAIKNTVSAVYGSWVVPNISAPSSPSVTTYSSLWVGIDGYNSSSVEQIGTAHEWHQSRPYHYAWFEMYPNASFEIKDFPVIPGDTITASVVYQGNDIFVMTLSNTTRKIYTTVPTVYTTSKTALRACAEWIAEAPFMKTILPLAHFSTVPFTGCKATINGITSGINDTHWQHDSITMKNALMVPQAIASQLFAQGQSFNATWLHE